MTAKVALAAAIGFGLYLAATALAPAALSTYAIVAAMAAKDPAIASLMAAAVFLVGAFACVCISEHSHNSRWQELSAQRRDQFEEETQEMFKRINEINVKTGNITQHITDARKLIFKDTAITNNEIATLCLIKLQLESLVDDPQLKSTKASQSVMHANNWIATIHNKLTQPSASVVNTILPSAPEAEDDLP